MNQQGAGVNWGLVALTAGACSAVVAAFFLALHHAGGAAK